MISKYMYSKSSNIIRSNRWFRIRIYILKITVEGFEEPYTSDLW